MGPMDEHAKLNGNGNGMRGVGSGTHAESWWGSRWARALSQLLNPRMLARGRMDAGAGRVLDLEIGIGVVLARVQEGDGTVCSVRVELQTLSDDAWDRVTATMGGQAIYAAQLLNGEMPMDIEAVFSAEGASLFPASRREFQAQCSCPDYARPCQHVAAVLWVIGERLDRDPFLLFALRGRTKEQFLAALRERRSRGAEGATRATGPSDAVLGPDGAAPSEDDIAGFWDLGPEVEALQVRVAPPEVEMEVIKLLGEPSFAEDEELLERLMRIYRAVTRKAQEVALDD
ncbi:MAG TPA: hypothetical protein GX714_16765 [Chloroflexi bacterium]|jgi:uncharacterized Zn finger protein|nr:hypothetical protein [Chloroflexota bacterium]